MTPDREPIEADFRVLHESAEGVPATPSDLPREPIIKDWGRAGTIVLNVLAASLVGWIVRSCVNGH